MLHFDGKMLERRTIFSSQLRVYLCDAQLQIERRFHASTSQNVSYVNRFFAIIQQVKNTSSELKGLFLRDESLKM